MNVDQRHPSDSGLLRCIVGRIAVLSVLGACILFNFAAPAVSPSASLTLAQLSMGATGNPSGCNGSAPATAK